MNENGISSATQLLFTNVYNSCFSKARLEKTLCIVSWKKIEINSSIPCYLCTKTSSENQTLFFLFAGKS